MELYEDNFYELAERDVKELRDTALKRVQSTYPEIKFVIDRRTIDDYAYKTWDYPGKWYYAGFKMPKGFHSKEDIINTIVKDTLQYFHKK